MNYTYGSDFANTTLDDHAVIALDDVNGDETNYSYDLSGNVITRSRDESGTQSDWNFAYDGEDQQRWAENPDGTQEYYYTTKTTSATSNCARFACSFFLVLTNVT